MGCNNSMQLASVLQPSSRAKVLCLHGGGSNSVEFSKQLEPVHAAMRALGGGPELVFLNGPLDARGMPNEVESGPANESGVVRPAGEEGQWRFCTGGHWRFYGGGDLSEKYGGAEDLEAWFVRVSEEHGPFLGVMGFGEGGTAAALFAGFTRPGGPLLSKIPSLQCLVLLCAAQLWV